MSGWFPVPINMASKPSPPRFLKPQRPLERQLATEVMIWCAAHCKYGMQRGCSSQLCHCPLHAAAKEDLNPSSTFGLGLIGFLLRLHGGTSAAESTGPHSLRPSIDRPSSCRHLRWGRDCSGNVATRGHCFQAPAQTPAQGSALCKIHHAKTRTGGGRAAKQLM